MTAKTAERKPSSAPQPKTRGFGVPDVIDPHHFVVKIPSSADGDILIVENFGLSAGSRDDETLLRCRLPRRAWNGIREEARRMLNDRLKEKNLKTSRWQVGDNLVERLLGKELCLLAWSVEAVDPSLAIVACASWAGLKPEERWWLFRMCDNATGAADDVDVGWRKAVRIALTEGAEPDTDRRAKRRPRDVEDAELPLFEDRNKP